MNIGAHISSAGGILKALERAESLNIDSLQIFISAPQSYKINQYNPEDIHRFNKLFKEKDFKYIFFHGIYLINLASETENLYQRSIESLIHYLTVGEKLHAVGTIFHAGSYNKIAGQARNDSSKFKRLISGLKTILENTPSSQYLIIENNANLGIGSTLEELVEIYHAVSNNRLKICIDTQHLFASGVDVRDFQIFSEWLKKFDTKIGIENLVVLHANDSKTELGSNRDRHENIGEGKIGEAGFENIMCQPLLQNKPFILEIPGKERKGPDLENLERIKKLSNVSYTNR